MSVNTCLHVSESVLEIGSAATIWVCVPLQILTHCNSRVSLKMCPCHFSRFLCSLWNVLAILNPFPFHMNFRINWSVANIKPPRILLKWQYMYRSVCEELRSLNIESCSPWTWYIFPVISVLFDVLSAFCNFQHVSHIICYIC